MKICFVGSAKSIHVQRWVKWFVERGHEIHLISPNYEKIEGVNIYKIGNGREGSIINFIKKMVQTRKLVWKIKPDILHAHYAFGHGTLAAFANYHPFVVSVWGSDVLVEAEKSKIKRIMVKHALKKADAVHSVGKNITKELTILGVNPEKITTIPMGIDNSIFNPNVEPLFKNENIIISTRNLKPVYNVELFIRAIPYVLNKIPDAKFIIAGKGEQQEYLENMAKEMSIFNNVKFVGHIPNEELPKWLASSKVYISTSLSDGTSTSLLEGMACGVFPIVTDIHANKAWIENGRNGFLVPVNKPKILAQKIIEAVRDDDLRKKAAKINEKVVKDEADWNKNFKKIEEIYSELCERK